MHPQARLARHLAEQRAARVALPACKAIRLTAAPVDGGSAAAAAECLTTAAQAGPGPSSRVLHWLVLRGLPSLSYLLHLGVTAHGWPQQGSGPASQAHQWHKNSGSRRSSCCPGCSLSGSRAAFWPQRSAREETHASPRISAAIVALAINLDECCTL